MNISCPGLHTARLSPPCAPGGPPQPPITTKGSCGQALPPRRTPRPPRRTLSIPGWGRIFPARQWHPQPDPQLTHESMCIRRWTHSRPTETHSQTATIPRRDP